MAPATMAPSPIPASTTASMTANAVEDEATYKRKNRNQITSSDRRTQPVPKLTKSRRHGGRYLASKRSGNVRSGISAALSSSILTINKAIAAATQTANPAAKLVP